ncbi:MAG TPA: hypothetical protein DIT13_07455, partial [Verrucomicrobiales bacterium]|nr:hypothetical protein [Verrucomicrobiales bacterium]
MLRFFASRLIQGGIVILAVLCITFVLLKRAPGSPLESERNIPEHIRAQKMAQLGLDQPEIVQLWR